MAFTDRLHNRGSISTGYDIDNSVKLEDDNTEWFSKTTGSDWNRVKWTASFWVKRGELGATSSNVRFFAASDSSYDFRVRFQGTADTLAFYNSDSTGSCSQNSSAVFRDTSAWYHIVAVWDTANSTAGNRQRLYVNGVEVTDFSTDTQPGLNQKSVWGKTNDGAGTVTMGIGAQYNYYSGFVQGYCGYMAEWHWVEGQALSPTDFGEFDDSNIWKPKEYTGSYGTNGFYLDFEDASDLGADASGNGNNWTKNNITSANQATDTPTNNFCTMNATNHTNGNIKTVEGATKVTTDGGSGWCSMVATMGVTKGKWYWETQRSGGSSDSNDVVTGIVGSEDAYIPYSSAAQYYIGNVATSSSMGFYTTGVPNVRNGDGGSLSNTAGDIIMIALDMDNDKLYFGVNGTWDALGTGGSTLHADFDGEFVLPAVAVYQGKQIKINFGGYASYTISSAQSDANGYGTFEYAVPSGYYALCTKNLAEYG